MNPVALEPAAEDTIRIPNAIAALATMACMLTLIALVWPRNAGALGFTPGLKLDYATGVNPQFVAMGDLNADGKPDLVIANQGANTVSVLLGNGSGSFNTKTDYATGAQPCMVRIGDINDDGYPDLVVANKSAGTVSVLLGNGLGAFGRKTDYPVGTTPCAVALGDVDGDGRPDIVTTNQGASTASVLLARASGGFAAKRDVAIGGATFALVLADVNNDGRLDLVTTSAGLGSGATVSVMPGDGAGGFGTRTDYTTGANPQCVAVADMNGDGWPDLVTAKADANTVSVLLGNGSGGFVARTDYVTGGTPLTVAVVDVNGDGLQDLVTANSNSNAVSLLLGTGAGAFGVKSDVATGTQPVCATVGDVNADGRPDIVTANAGANTVSVLLGNSGPLGTGGFGPRSDNTVGAFPASVAIGDLNGDGRLDLVTTNEGTNTVSVLLGSGSGGFGTKTDFATGATPISAAIGDLNADGKLDLVVTNFSAGTVSVLLGAGSGGFGPKTDVTVGVNPQGIALGDLNGDGYLDLAVANWGAGTVSVRLGTGTGGFGAKTDFAVGSYPQGIALGDLNGDGRLDLVTANNTANSVSVLLGTGTGSFGANTEFATGSVPASVAIGDMNGDGKPDLVVANNNSSSVSLLLGTGTGSFGTKTDYATGAGPAMVRIGDLNGDGRLDLAVADQNASASAVSVLLGNGAGGFGTKTDIAIGTSPGAIAIGDLNGDGRLDLVTANPSTNAASVLLGLGSSHVLLSASPNPVVLGAPWTLSATVRAVSGQATPTGSVRFFDGTTALGSDSLSGGTVVLHTFSFAPGRRSVTAVYGGDGRCFGRSGDTTVVVVATLSPVSAGVRDVPNDQGGYVKVSWTASPLDVVPTYGISDYRLWRSAPQRLMAQALAAGRTVVADPETAIRTGQLLSAMGYAWEYVGTEPAAQLPLYSTVAATTSDSVGASNPRTAFMIEARADTSRSSSRWFSDPDSGYSVDNLPPATPSPLASQYAGGTARLFWRSNSEADLAGYRIYRGSAPSFVPGSGNLVAVVAGTGYVDAAGGPYYYKLSAADVHGNESAYATLLPSGTTDVHGAGAPVVFALEGVRPNPSRGRRLTVAFTLPLLAPARLEMLDVGGRRVASREVGSLGAGAHVVELVPNHALAPGLYLLRLAQGANVRVTRVAVAQ